MYPLKFEPFLRPMIWGGEKIAAYKGVETSVRSIGESWELSGVAGHESIVAEGPCKGVSLPELIDRYGAELVGKSNYERFGNEFPLLVKFIDARKDLSIQVHPDDRLAWERHRMEKGHTKRRLTYRGFLELYKQILTDDGKICFKTDNAGLFEFSLDEFKEAGFCLSEVTDDLHNSIYNEDNIETEYERNFSAKGFSIHRLVASMPSKCE